MLHPGRLDQLLLATGIGPQLGFVLSRPTCSWTWEWPRSVAERPVACSGSSAFMVLLPGSELQDAHHSV